jgi:hypothetical protein
MTVEPRPSFTGAVPGRATGKLVIPRRPRRPRPDGSARRLAELLALTAFAITQPVLDVTGRSPDFFLYRQATVWDLRLLLALVVLAPPLLLWAVELAAGRFGRVAHLLFVGGLFATICVEVGKKSGPFTGVPLALLGLAVGAALGVAATRWRGFRQTLVYSAPAPLVFALLFGLTSPAGALLRPARNGSGVAVDAGRRPPVVVMFLDELPERALLDEHGQVDPRLFPNFARLAGQSTWYPNATGVIGWTTWAVPAMLSGRWPQKAVAPTYAAYPRNLFTLLSRSYDVKAFETVTRLCPPAACSAVPAGHRTGLGPLVGDAMGVAREIVSPYPRAAHEGENLAESAGPATPSFTTAEAGQPERVTKFFDSLDRRGPAPPLTFLHVLLPHIPYRYLPSGVTYPEFPTRFALGRLMEGKTGGERTDETGAMMVTKQRMLLQLVYADRLVGELMDRLKASGAWRDSLVVVTSDHGGGFSRGELSRQLGDHNVPELAYVPLFVKLPGQTTGKVDDRNAMHVDLLPTVADALDVHLPFPVDGISLLGKRRPTLAKTWYDRPGEIRHIDGARYVRLVHVGMAPKMARPDLGPEGLFAVGPLRDLVGRKVSEYAIGSRAPGVARSRNKLLARDLHLESGVIPALLWGDLDAPLGPGRMWLVVAVNGTIAGDVYAAPSRLNGKWHFVGMAADRYFLDGHNDVALYTVDGGTLHPLTLVR